MIPDGWLLLPPDLAANAKHKAMQALRTDGAHAAQHRLARFYDADGDYAGASFAQLGPIDTNDITPADIQAAMAPLAKSTRARRQTMTAPRCGGLATATGRPPGPGERGMRGERRLLRIGEYLIA